MSPASVPRNVAPVAEDLPLARDARLMGIGGASASRRRPRAGIFGPGRERLWLAAALGFTLLFAARTMAPAFLHGAIQEDAVLHVFWMQRYRDPELFRGDLYADYRQWLAPPGYALVYWTLTRAVDPLAASKLLPPVLGCAAALFIFCFVRRLHPSPTAAFLGTVLLSWYVWQYDDLASATPRAFLLPTLTALLWSLAAGHQAAAVALSVLAALLYPVGGALAVALLGVRLVRFERWRPGLVRERSAWIAFSAAAALVAGVLAPSQLADSPYGPFVSAAQARTMPEFGPGGRLAFFAEGGYRFLAASSFSGLDLRVSDAQFPAVPILLEYLGLAGLLPLLLPFRRRLPGADQLSGQAAILLQLLVASFGLFLLAHLLLFRLFLPSRYVKWSLPLVLSVAAGLALAIVIHAVAVRIRPARPAGLAAALALLFAGGVAFYPARYRGWFQPDRHPTIAAYLRTQPKDVLVATGVAHHADWVPARTGRRVLVAREYAVPYHLGYYREVRQRVEDLIDAYYDEGATRLAALVERYGVDFFLVDDAAFDAATYTRVQGRFEPFSSAIAARLEHPRRYTLQELARRCAIVRDGELALVPATCLDS